MHFRICVGVAALALHVFAAAAYSQGTTAARFSGSGTGGYIGPIRPADMTAQADVVIVGKVVDIDKTTIDASPYRGAPKDRIVTYKIATIKIEDPLIGGRGLTQYRVGFPSDEQKGTFRPLPVGGAPLTADQEACFFLVPHHDGDFYILSSAPIHKKNANYAKQIEEVKKVAKVLDDPVAALKAKDIEDRFKAAQTILQRYQTNRTGRTTTREPIPAEENKLILELLAELPWVAKDTKPRPATDPVAPSRSAIWHLVYAHESGYRSPTMKGGKGTIPAGDYNKVNDEATAKFLKENMDKIKIKRFSK